MPKTYTLTCDLEDAIHMQTALSVAVHGALADAQVFRAMPSGEARDILIQACMDRARTYGRIYTSINQALYPKPSPPAPTKE